MKTIRVLSIIFLFLILSSKNSYSEFDVNARYAIIQDFNNKKILNNHLKEKSKALMIQSSLTRQQIAKEQLEIESSIHAKRMQCVKHFQYQISGG